MCIRDRPLNDLYAQNAPLTRQDGYSIDSLVSAHPASAVTPYFVVKDFACLLYTSRCVEETARKVCEISHSGRSIFSMGASEGC